MFTPGGSFSISLFSNQLYEVKLRLFMISDKLYEFELGFLHVSENKKQQQKNNNIKNKKKKKKKKKKNPKNKTTYKVTLDCIYDFR